MTDPITAQPIARSGHLPMEAVHVDDREWETLRWDGQWSKMLFHPRPDRPTEPNAGLVRYEPGAHHPRHQHDFAQVWYIVEGEFSIGGKTYRPGTMLFYPDPHFEEPLVTETGGRHALRAVSRADARVAVRSMTAASTCRRGARIGSAWTSEPAAAPRRRHAPDQRTDLHARRRAARSPTPSSCATAGSPSSGGGPT